MIRIFRSIVLINVLVLFLVNYGCKKEEKAVIPTLSTTAISNISSKIAVSGGNIISDGGANITARGVCWSKGQTPTISDSRTNDSISGGYFTSLLTNLDPLTTYYVRAYASNNVGTGYGNINSFTTLQVVKIPELTTTAASNITQNTAISGGDITSDGGGVITARGVCWGINQNPTTVDSKTSEGTGTGKFFSNITGLSANSTYYLRAYAINNAGTGYGNEILIRTYYGVITDIDGNTYKTVKIGGQTWMAENLKTTKYNDGTIIPNVTDNSIWGALTSPAYCWYNNDSANYKAIYGALYNWYTIDISASGTKNVCPTGWHVSTKAEWDSLTIYLGGGNVAGGKLKEIGNSHWISPNVGASNSSGFTAVPGGTRGYFVFGEDKGRFDLLGSNGYWWCSSKSSDRAAWYREIESETNLVYKGDQFFYGGFSVRCLRDN